MASSPEDSPGAAHDGENVHPPLRRNKSSNSLRLLTELTRERISLRYLHAWTELHKPEFIHRNAFPDSDRPMPMPASSTDTGLAAFTQLASLRMDVRRAFVTIMSRDTEYVLVEATRTMSLQSDFTADDKDGNWLGTSCFARADGMNDIALDGWRRARKYREPPVSSDHYYTEGLSPHWCIVSDASVNPDIQERPFVARAESPRFFFSIPLRDADGTVIGAISMLDDKPRYGVSAQEMLFCEDLADTIAQHIFGSIISTQRQRSERLIQALGTFNSGGSSLRDWWIRQDSTSMQRGDRHRGHAPTNERESARFDHVFGKEENHSELPLSKVEGSAMHTSKTQSRHPRSASDGNDLAALNRTDNNVVGHDFSAKPAQSVGNDNKTVAFASQGLDDNQHAPPQHKEARHRTSISKDPESAGGLKDAYARASNLLRESTGCAGVIYVDASAASTSSLLRRSNSRSASRDQASISSNTTTSASASSDDSRPTMTSDTDTSDHSEKRSKLCRVVGYSTQVQASEDGVRPPPLQLIERDLAKLIKSYPSGKVFNYAASGTPYSGSDDSAGSGVGSSESATGGTKEPSRSNTKHNRHARLLRKVVGDARSIAFYPIWDNTNQRYGSCLFAWTLHANRFFDSKEDMTYLSAFGHSLSAEISRVETIASDVAKGKFISSISHELRSPLHGILAGVELLQDSELTPFQEEMALSVALAGRTLLDTVNHILDYSKISNLTHGQKKDRTRVNASRQKLADIKESDGASLAVVDLAQITEEVVESVVSAHRYSRSFERGDSDKKNQRPASLEKDDISFVLDIDKRDSWSTAMTPGSWTRVLSNIVGNALKYTHSGTISVKLFTDEDRKATNHDDATTYVILRVNDTGIGMSQDFIANGMFTPFRQADSHSPGTGLGLSIVKEVAKEFKGSLVVDSEIGKGSSVSVRFAAKFTQRTEAEDDGVRPSSISRRICMLHAADSSITTASRQTPSVGDSLQRTASQWLGCEILESQGLKGPDGGSLCVISEEELLALHKIHANGVKILIDSLAESGSQVLIFGRSISSCQSEFEFESFRQKPLYIHQPIGPRKLRRVIQHAKDSTITRKATDFGAHSMRGYVPTPRIITGDTPTKRPNARQPESYFELPRNRDTRTPSSLITPTSFMDASSVETPGAQPPASRENETPAVPSESENSQSDGDTVLLVEDNAINMRLLIALMKKQGLPYECASDGLQALNKYKESPARYFLILMDLNMPVCDGFQSTAKIREFERRNKLPAANIAALTGVANDDARNKALDAGVNRYLTKPIQMKELTKLVTETREGG